MGKLIEKYMNMKTKNQLIPISIGVLIFSLLSVLYIFAWTGPSQNPPGGNVAPPLNATGTGQVKRYVNDSNKGWLGISIPEGETYDSSYGLTVGTASNPMGIKTSGDVFIEGRLRGIQPSGAYCSNNQILKYDSANNNWICADDKGTIEGSGSANRIAFFNSGNSITSDSNLYWDNTNKRLGIGTTNPTAKFDLKGTKDATQKGYVSTGNSSMGLESPQCACDTGSGFECSQCDLATEPIGTKCWDRFNFGGGLYGSSEFEVQNVQCPQTTHILMSDEGDLSVTGPGVIHGNLGTSDCYWEPSNPSTGTHLCNDGYYVKGVYITPSGSADHFFQVYCCKP